ncbi:MAG TPA: phosphate acyltransferase, partial [Candidatus Omnitrophota bacterium]|nr:phosphate acyltransferase [Candidatus Omnitrophota bacterium]
MDIIKEMRLRSKKRQKLIVLPEKADPRIKEAAKIIQKEGIARIAVLGKEDLEQKKIEQFAQVFFELRKHKGMTVDEARRVVGQPLYYAAMMVRLGEADGFVAGAANSTPDVARSAIYCLGVDPKINIVSSCFVMVVPDCSFGENGVFIFADCGIVPSPDARQLAGIAISSAKLAEDLFAMTPRVAMLSYSTKGSAKGEFVDKVVEAAKLAKFARPDLLIDGELQL